MRLTVKTLSGTLKLRGMTRKQLDAGEKITGEVHQKLCQALQKLAEYEDTGLSPNGVQAMLSLVQEQAMQTLVKLQESRERMQKTKGLYKWISVEEKLPQIGELCVVIAQRSRWIADYGATWLPEEEKSDHPEWTFPSVAYFRGENWDLYSPDDEAFYATGEKGPEDWEDLSTISERVIAWMPLPELNREEKR
ncbi:hypothetical protein [Brotaphodocola sp.]|uniref:hypothetical protein n=1 Tax=Brotaphodocola sp. TaxID=3073577 RepID=UPI003D7CE959